MVIKLSELESEMLEIGEVIEDSEVKKLIVDISHGNSYFGAIYRKGEEIVKTEYMLGKESKFVKMDSIQIKPFNLVKEYKRRLEKAKLW